MMKKHSGNEFKVERKIVLPRIRGAKIPKENLPPLPERYHEFSDSELEDVFSEKLWRYPRRVAKRTKSSSSSEKNLSSNSSLSLVWSKELTTDLKLLANVSGTRRNSLEMRSIQDYVMSYADRRIIGEDLEGENILLESQKRKNEHILSGAPLGLPLSFTKDVIEARANPVFSPYDEEKESQLYKYKSEHSLEQRKGRLEPRVVTQHKLCLPESDPAPCLRRRLRVKPRKDSIDGEILVRNVPNSTHVWEEFVVGLVSKRTAQWIANHCASGPQRSRLVSYLDHLYKEFYPGGTETVNKLLDINDDCITLPRRRGEPGNGNFQHE